MNGALLRCTSGQGNSIRNQTCLVLNGLDSDRVPQKSRIPIDNTSDAEGSSNHVGWIESLFLEAFTLPI